MRHSMMIDLDLCVGCMACVSACKEQWDSGPGAARDWVHTFERGTRGNDLAITFYPGLCMQCELHPCTTDCPTGATFMDDKGVVVVDGDICIGCGNCISNCAYGARHVDEVKRIVEKCNLCKPYVARGEQPACVSTCLAGCRIFGDLDDPNSPIVKSIAERKALPLFTPEVSIGPKVAYAGEIHRAAILAKGVVKQPEPSWLTKVWTGWSLPLARGVVPALGSMAVLGGLMVNLKARRDRIRSQQEPPVEPSPPPCPLPEELPRHTPGMRFLHWFNALSWLLLLSTGTALMSARSFALFGQEFPRWLADVMGGVASMIRFHAVWGLLWAAVIVPLFLLYKRGGREALEEVWLTRDDIKWLMIKPFAMMGWAKQPLPPQHKYNGGQKIFAITAVLGTATIIATGVVMTFHLGSPAVLQAAILVHKLAIALAILGLSVHITMAAIIAEERPAFRSMVTGRISRHHAAHHNSKWVDELEKEHNSAQVSKDPADGKP